MAYIASIGDQTFPKPLDLQKSVSKKEKIGFEPQVHHSKSGFSKSGLDFALRAKFWI